MFATPARELKYVLRAYGSGGTFDETVPQPLWIAYRETGRGGREAAENAGDASAGRARDGGCAVCRALPEPATCRLRRAATAGRRAARRLRRERLGTAATFRSRAAP